MDQLKIVGLFLVLSLIQAKADQSPSLASSSDYHFDDQIVFNRFLGTDYILLNCKDLRPETKIALERDIYGFLFQCWMVKKYRNTPVLAPAQVAYIVRLTSPYVDKNDPMYLDRFYEGDNLNGFGIMRSRSEVLANCEQIFGSKQKYHAFVAQFLDWTDAQIKGMNAGK